MSQSNKTTEAEDFTLKNDSKRPNAETVFRFETAEEFFPLSRTRRSTTHEEHSKQKVKKSQKNFKSEKTGENES